ncbi:hypothetical protein [Leisingera sp. M658]|uniref:hypothetical protein n=1 Tax=Leisingera sp. M658 TaxID=2867015 RepID=UPI0021A3331F|nr:hypothetical protein [Leisingera sp. M658]UWQ73301.1 hypothetical protein K3724_12055 [Leisingera sp. M658]
MNNQNCFPDLCEFLVKYQNSDDDEAVKSCVVDLRVASGEVPLGDYECLIEFTRLFISVDHEGMDVVSGSLYGDPKRPNEVSRSNQIQEKQEDKGLITGAMELTRKGFTGSGKLERARTQATNRELTLKEEGTDLRVKARPNLRWEVREPSGEPLDSTFLADDKLLALTKKPDANRSYSSLELKVKQRDLRISPVHGDAQTEKRFAGLTTTKKRLLDIFIAKSLSNASYSNQQYRGEILISRCEYNHEE